MVVHATIYTSLHQIKAMTRTTNRHLHVVVEKGIGHRGV